MVLSRRRGLAAPRPRIIAAAAAALEVLDLRARYVSEADDRPRAWLERFARGEERIGACPWREVENDRPLFGLLYRLSDAREAIEAMLTGQTPEQRARAAADRHTAGLAARAGLTVQREVWR